MQIICVPFNWFLVNVTNSAMESTPPQQPQKGTEARKAVVGSPIIGSIYCAVNINDQI